MTRVEGVIFFETDVGSRPNVVSSISAKIGLLLTNKIEFAVEINENEGVITSSEFPTHMPKELHEELKYQNSRKHNNQHQQVRI